MKQHALLHWRKLVQILQIRIRTRGFSGILFDRWLGHLHAKQLLSIATPLYLALITDVLFPDNPSIFW